MPLLWKKRNQKVAAPIVVAEEAKSHKLCSGQDVLTVSPREQNSTAATGNDGIVFVLVIKDFTAIISDELSVCRGHVVQQLYEDSAWSYVRSIDGKSGYIPSSVTCSLDDIQSRGEWFVGRPISRKSKILLQNNTSNGIQSSQPAFQRRGVPSVCPKLNDPHTASNACTNNQETSAIIELSSSPYAVPSLHPLHPLSLCKSMSPKNSSSSKYNSDCHAQPTFDPPSISIHARTQSYQEAVTDHEPSSYHIYNIPIERHSRPRNLPLRPNGLQSNQLTFTNTTSYTTTGLRTTTTQASQFDDVFLPCNNKPIGIFKSTGKYDKTVPGEVSLDQNEYVIVTEMGESEWAWIISASGNEGVVPKCLLARYNPASERLDTVGTQTELIVMAPMSTIPARPLLHQRNRTTSREVETHTIRLEEPEISLQRTEVAVQTDHMSPVIMDVWSQSQTIDEFWYENSMSIPRLNGFSFSGIESPSICTLPTINGINESACMHGSRHSLPHLPLFNTLHSKKSSTADVTATLDSNSSFSPASGVRPNVVPQNNASNPQTIVLKVVRSYIPGANEVDHLHLNKGDILHIYSGNNTVHRNWVWAYHMEQGAYGYVPKSHTAFLCVTNYFRHVNGGTIRYDEV